MEIHDPYAAAGTFRKAQLHTHTRRSDGRLEPEALLRRYREAGYAFVCLTDHNRVTRCDALDGPDFLAVAGVEETVVRGMYPLGPHLSRLFVGAALGRGSAQERLDATQREGGVAVLNHPSWKGNLLTGEWRLAEMLRLRGPFLVEVANPHSRTEEDVRRWAAVLQARPREEMVGAVASDDAHAAGHIGRAWIMVKVPVVDEEHFRHAVQALAFYATTGPEIDPGVTDGAVRCLGAPTMTMRFIDRENHVRAEGRGPDARYRPIGDEGFIRVEAVDGTGRPAWSQPFWIDTAAGTERGEG